MMTELKNELNNISMTENGAVGHLSTHNDLVDLNFRMPSMREGISDRDLFQFENALKTNHEYAVKWLFYLRDIRGGAGERDSFTFLYRVYYDMYPSEALTILSLVETYGRYKDLVDIAFTCDGSQQELKNKCFDLISAQLQRDIADCIENKPISLLAKWLPSINASAFARRRAIELTNHFGITKELYRKTLSKLRKYLDVTEIKTCGNDWGCIDYNKVSSNANLRYSDAFLKHDRTRRTKYLLDVLDNKAGVKMNASDLYPYEIWHKYSYPYPKVKNDGYEAMWKNLKDVGEVGNTLVVVDGSGSMCNSISGTSATALDVSRSLGVYFAERCTGEFHNKCIEFSSNPKFIDLDDKETLYEKISYMNKFHDCSNTDIEKVFMLILKTAVNNRIPQEELPQRILIISDMEFDDATTLSHGFSYRRRKNDAKIEFNNTMKTLFDNIEAEYLKYGYKLPRLVFWNVASRTNTIPMTENEFGVALISGFSVNLAKMVMSKEIDPWEMLKEMLDDKRYQPISDTLKQVNDEI